MIHNYSEQLYYYKWKASNEKGIHTTWEKLAFMMLLTSAFVYYTEVHKKEKKERAVITPLKERFLPQLYIGLGGPGDTTAGSKRHLKRLSLQTLK